MQGVIRAGGLLLVASVLNTLCGDIDDMAVSLHDSMASAEYVLIRHVP